MANSIAVYSVFMNHIPFEVDSKWLFKIFKKCGMVEEVFIPYKRSKNGRNFGFVRFKDKIAAKDSAKKNFDNCTENRNGGFHTKEKIPIQNTSLKSCLGSVNGKIIEILKKSVVGFSMKRADGNYLKECFIKEGVFNIDLRPISYRVFLLSFDDEDIFKSMEEAKWSWLQNCFIKIVLWNDEFLLPPRCAWLKCSGVPLIGWSKEIFNSIAGLWGKLICLDFGTKKYNQFHHGYILVAYDVEEKIDKVIEVVINGRACRVKIKVLIGDPKIYLEEPNSKSKLEISSSKSSDNYSDGMHEEVLMSSNEIQTGNVGLKPCYDMDISLKPKVINPLSDSFSQGLPLSVQRLELKEVVDSLRPRLVVRKGIKKRKEIPSNQNSWKRKP